LYYVLLACGKAPWNAQESQENPCTIFHAICYSMAA